MLFTIHPDTPQARLIEQVVAIFRNEGVVVYPTDSSYAIGCIVGNQRGMDRILKIRQESAKDHYFSLICKDLSELSHYAVVDNPQYRLLKAILPGPYTLILRGTKEVPKKLLMPKRNTVGLRVPNHVIIQAVLAELGAPILSTTLKIPGYEAHELNDATVINEIIGDHVDAIIDGGACSMAPTTVIDLSEGAPEVLRKGQGSTALFE
ncbi:L-threonylcarbamoyladenylate synthase [Ignatzschineria cameli]|uniref:Threonylcarbamoyl-AMP synthase n=1 Tax=Ignatzschineria cameli TaxID=2182793 RepID=A0A2U2AQH4_9GAMM|nr:L-threonylcarbamoyladenylate synthase [Ignatzschineria cameli]PWD82980.1 threonylcarbamoyl-AMP synthase [Ignatzschineria cameli]PWD85882.1 threonylcarbamoyl-AMP synthase [Ignatzschineria cameli]PWD89510.1 threonylcarbamoyl-AMP synthase [Ignatzschineria cameli]PWD90982.1 threonylcarbamoyl-AMP synthase [Ignatzschineria cameli]PWD91770.1 threonylcarbamoyl-AMP synthase [Ignatzschineria cameli]